jgi:hypothetical protein
MKPAAEGIRGVHGFVAAQGHQKRYAEGLRKHRGGDPVRIREVSVDDVERELFAQAADRAEELQV